MLKDFISWIQYKILLQNTPKTKVFKEREVWWCSLGVNLGREMDGKNSKFNRPVLIVKKFNHNQFWAIPLTSKIKQESELYFRLNIKGKISYACLSQIRVMDSKRLNNAISEVENSIFLTLIEKIKNLFPK